MDTSNKFMVGMRGEEIIIMRPLGRMSREDALNLAAWLVCLADPGETEFSALMDAIQS